jgi:hypothetical protein
MTDSISRKFARLGTGVSATGTLTVNSATASAWATPRTLTLDGHLSGNVSIDGSHNVTLTASIVNNTVVLGTHTTGNYVSDITAGTGITVSGSGSETASVTIGLNTSGVTANTYGSSTAVPVLAIDTYGRITSASTASVSSSISIAGDTGTDSVSLISDTLTFTGGTGITSAVTNNTVTLDIDNTVTTNSGSQTLTNKTISGADNTLSNIGNSSLTNSSITINGVATSLGGTRTLVTDDIAEDGSPVNLWFTNARARGAVSVTDSGGDGSLAYDSGTGVFTYTGPSATEVRAHFTAGTGVSISSGQVSIGQAVATNSNVTFNDVTVSGNLTVSGTTTTINTETINLADNTIVLNSNEAGTPSQDGGIEVERGVSTNATLLWDETNDYWKAGLSGSEVPLVTTTGTQTLTNKTINASQLVDGSVSNAKLTNSTISGKALGTNLDTLTMNVSGTGLSGSSSYNGSGAATFTVTSNATSANTGSTIVARDASGNFSAGTITATLSGNVTGNVTGNASTATTLQTQRAINGVAFNGSADITVADSTKLPLTGGTLSGNLTVDTKIYAGGATVSSGYNGVYATNMVGAASGNKLIYLYNDGTTIKLDAYDYGVSGALSFNIGGNGGTPNLYTGSTVNNNVILHAGNYSSYPIMRYAGVFTGNFQDLTDSVGELRIDQVDNINGGGYSNQPPNVYTYGGVLSWRTANHSFQLYASHTGDLTFKTQWQNDNYSGWRRILHESNYTSFAPSLTGSGASGTWGISVTGSAGSAGSATTSTTQAHSDTSTNIATTAWVRNILGARTTGGTADWNDVSNTRPGTGYTLLLGTATNGMGGGNYYHPFNLEYSSNDGTGNVTQMAYAYGTPANEMYMRGRYGGSWTGWVRFINSGNYTSYSPSLTGSGASGTWGINITGNAATVTNGLTTSNYSSYAIPIGGGINMSGSFGLNDSRLYLRTNGDTNHYLWNADDDYEELRAYTLSGFRVRSSGGEDLLIVYGAGNGGYSYSPYSFRAPIFYDSDNTGYYTNPASTSVLYDLTLSGSKHTYLNINPGNGYEAMVYYNGGGSGSAWYVGKRTTSQVVGTESFHFYSVAASRTLAGVDTSGNMMSDGSMRSPVFYDYNDTGYYIDPNSTGNSALRIRGGTLHGPNTSWGAYLYVGTNGRPDSTASVCATNGNLHLDCANGNLMYLNYYSGNAIIATDFRPTIIYDQDDTGYYVNPNSTTYLYNLILAGGGYFRPNNWIQIDGGTGLYWPNHYGAHLYPNNGSTYTQLRIDGSKNGYSGMWAAHSSVNFGMYDSAGNGGVYREANGLWYFYYLVGNGCMGIGTSSTNSSYGVYVVKGGYFDGRVDGTIFYDANNTNYYCDPNGTARLSYVVANGGIRIDGNEDLYLDYNYGCSIVGVYSSYRYQGVFSMGNSYKLARDGTTTGNLYGMAWSHPNAGGIAGNLNDHGLLVLVNGSWAASLTGSTRSRDDMRAPIFYDNNNTGYYCDPNSVSQLSYVLANDWFRPQGSTGLYFQDYGYGLRSAHGEGNSYGNATTYGTGRNGWSGWGIGTRHVFMSTTGDNVGVHDNSRGWIWYWNGSNTTFEHGYTVFAGSARAPIFYDSNDTGYYCDPASTSYMYRTIFQGRMLFYGADQSSDGTNDAQLYFTPGGGLTIASITTSFETGFVGSSYPQNRQVGAQATYDKRFYVWQDLVQYYSDERLKEKTGTLNGALEAIKSWTPFKYVDNALANSFNFGSSKTQIGLSAQEVEAFYPELVELAPFDVENDFSDETNPRRVSKSGENYLTLNYTRLVPILVQAIKEQQAKIEELENRINNS